MSLLNTRRETTRIKSISFSDQPDIHRLYLDAAAITSRAAEGLRHEKSLELINLMADAEVLTALSVCRGAPQYLLLARRPPYQALSEAFSLYLRLEELAAAEDNHVILTP